MNLFDIPKLTTLAEITAQNAGKCLLDAYSSDSVVLNDSGKDIKTEADKTAEATAIREPIPNILLLLNILRAVI